LVKYLYFVRITILSSITSKSNFYNTVNFIYCYWRKNNKTIKIIYLGWKSKCNFANISFWYMQITWIFILEFICFWVIQG